MDVKKALSLAAAFAEKQGLVVNNICVENFEGWRFALVDKTGEFVIGQPPVLVTTDGELDWDFRGEPPEPIKDAKIIDISEYLK